MSEERKGEEGDEKEKVVENAEDEEDTVKKKPWRHNMKRPRDGDEDGNNKGTGREMPGFVARWDRKGGRTGVGF